MLYFPVGSRSRGERLISKAQITGLVSMARYYQKQQEEMKICVDIGRPFAFRDYTVLFHVLRYFFP